MMDVGTRIAEARGRAQMTQAELAAAASLDRSALAKIETGQRRVGAIELARIADALDERIEWFVTDAPKAIVSHRNLQEPGAPSRAVDILVERIARNVEFVVARGALDLAEAPQISSPSSADAVERAATKIRSTLGLTSTEPMIDIAGRVAAVGLLAFSVSVGMGAADAASILLASGGVAIVNGDMKVGRRRLALAHELGHYVFADEYNVDFDVARHGDDEQWEGRLDRFARAVLLPGAGLRTFWSRLRENGGELRVAAIRTASTYRVDMSTLARRLRELGLASASEAETVRAVRTARADIVDLELLVSHELEPPVLPRLYERAVLGLYRDDEISADRALELLLDTWSEEDLPSVPLLPEQAIWKFVS